MKKKKGFTLIEVLIVIAIISILAAIILVNINQSRKNARLNNAKTTLKTAMLIVIACNDANSPVSVPSGAENGTRDICPITPNSHWPSLQGGYTYNAGGNFTSACSFTVDTNDDSTSDLNCTCNSLICN